MNPVAKNSVQGVEELKVSDRIKTAESVNALSFVKSLARSLVKWVITTGLAASVAVVITARITRIFTGPESYKIYVVGKMGAKDELKQLFDSIPDGVVPNLTIDTKPIKVEKRDDKGDPQYAEQIAREIVGSDDTLLVVGHALSTQTKVALPYYVGGAAQAAKPSIPVILTTETNPELLPRGVSGGFCPAAMRLSPTDDEQADTAASFAVSQANNFWVVADTQNSVYSQYLTSQFISQVNRSNKRVILSSTTQNTPSFDALKALKIDAVFFAGGWINALTLIRQVRAFTDAGAFPTVPIVILSDGAVDTSLLREGKNDVNGIFLVHPLRASEYTDEARGYKQYGNNAYILAKKLIEETDQKFSTIRWRQARFSYSMKRILNVHRVNDARAVLVRVIQSYVTHKNAPNSLTDCKYQRKETVDENDAGFHIWEIRNGEFTDVPSEVLARADKVIK